MNRIIITGRLTKAPEPHTTQGGISRSTLTVAVQRKFKNSAGNYDADFFTVIAWRQTADFCNKYLDKGRTVIVEGTLQTRSYDAQDGSKRYVTEIIADHIEAIGGREDNRPADAPRTAPKQETGDFEEVDDPELPF